MARSLAVSRKLPILIDDPDFQQLFPNSWIYRVTYG